MSYRLSKKIGEKYRILISDKGEVLRQMGPRKLSKDRAEYRIALLNGVKPFDYTNDDVSPVVAEALESVQNAINGYIASQEAKIEQVKSSIQTFREQIIAEQANVKAQQAIINDPNSSPREVQVAKDVMQASLNAIEARKKNIVTLQNLIKTCQNNINNAPVNQAPKAVVKNVSSGRLVFDNTAKKGYDVVADFSVNETTVIEANEFVEGGIGLNNTSENPANLVINVGNSDVYLDDNTKWDEVTVKSAGNLTVRTTVHINKLILKRGEVLVNNALVEDCVDEIVVEGGTANPNPEVEAQEAIDFIKMPAIVNINSALTFEKIAPPFSSKSVGHYIYVNNAEVNCTASGSSNDDYGFKFEGSGAKVDFKGEGTWTSATNPTIWLSDATGEVNIYSGKFFQTNNSDEVIYAKFGTINIYGGEFHNTPVEGQKNFLLNCYDQSYKDGSAKIVVYGGKFYGFNPAANGAESEDMSTNFVAEGYKSVYNEEEGYYEVVKDE